LIVINNYIAMGCFFRDCIDVPVYAIKACHGERSCSTGVSLPSPLAFYLCLFWYVLKTVFIHFSGFTWNIWG